MNLQVPPHDMDAEGSVLASCLLDSGLLDELRGVLAPGDFYADANRRIWEAAATLVDASRPVDAVTIASELRQRGRLEQVGGVPYLVQLLEATPAVANVAEHARTVADLARRRRVISACQRIAIQGYGDVGDPSEWFERVEADVLAATNDGASANESSTMSELVSEQIRIIKARSNGEAGGPMEFAGIRWSELRRKLCGGWRRAKMHVLAGRPGMGKTAAALGCAAGAARIGEGVVFASLEMTREELTQRAISSESMVALPTVMGGELDDDQWRSVTGVAGELGRWPMSLTHCPGASISRLRSIIRREMARVRREFGVDVTLVIVDYVQLIDGERRKGESREAQVSDFCRKLTAMAGELNVALLMLSQLNRDLEKRPNKRPQLSDLRESGAIEQDAYSVSFLYRDEEYHANSPDVGVVEWIVAKHRNGATGSMRLKWDKECVRIDDIASAPDGYEDQFENERGCRV
jgi:replicative DNA helicase